ncbi:MAG: hypothetical protein A2V81_01390 [Candidatus Abawacabacteria bacterium RBG_16_42_10]|uniref:Solute-binding protein family 5 domain-containing protein n=1 Tax=Candidatus Abawacabacteria bacterium RBG_16_42_10 TaxID=1817814 RepID=A0A1F4XLI3_9BACT|nr:MAG: hypothetical protein A2V81_01390 [Candidatus Abawacabacteria bacterium RBG_16_42_10]
MIEAKKVLHLFSRFERFWLSIFLVLAIISSTFILDQTITSSRTKTLASTGGTFSVGLTGTVDSINPLYCTSSMTIRAVCSLVFTGLTKIDPFSHEVKGDLASQIDVGNDLKTYTVTLKPAFFHDNKPVTSQDVIFTYEKLLKDPGYDGPYKGAFNSVKIEATDASTIIFTLDEPNTFFPYSLTIGIVPAHILSEVQNIKDFSAHPFNRNPIGTGIFKVESFSNNTTSSEINLKSFSEFYGTKPYIERLYIMGYQSEENLRGDISKYDFIYSDNLEPANVPSNYQGHQFLLPQYVGLFFNTSTGPMSSKLTRLALKVATDREDLAKDDPKLKLIDSPFPDILTDVKITYNLEKAKGFLQQEKITPENPIEVKLVYKNDETLEMVAKKLQEQWRPLGINCILIGQDFGELQTNFLKTRDYDILLLGERLGGNIDLYPYLHSSQLKYPGLNFSVYKNVAVDNLLDKIRLTIDEKEQKKLLSQAYEKISADMPFLILYTPYNTVFIHKRIQDAFLPSYPSVPEQIYSLITSWYIAEKQIWI